MTKGKGMALDSWIQISALFFTLSMHILVSQLPHL